ncbi:hypothetical protein M378DRAFT_7351 [Amanita muscaria Koide BX008]|uniref:Uncharacterized protein n=1 Tax=Amanita muscaria (strain Koide BX008) TaxID=946122 RepID=A0A0C2XLZ6_AMAMK|nr:hypothetical protein M378DRAFT_7351 [Amanita muscaria Koide BX008]
MPPTASGLIKRRRSNETPAATELVISSAGVVQRTSNLEAPIISLSGAHSAEILSCRFDPAGQNIAACSADKYFVLTDVLSQCQLRPYSEHILDLQRPSVHRTSLSLVSTDYTLTSSQENVSLAAGGALGTELVPTASDDKTVRFCDAGENEGNRSV